MLILKRFMFLAVFFILTITVVTGQTRSGATLGNREMTVEQSYLQESVELMIIREQSRAESREMKMIALEYIGDAIDRGNRGEEVRAALEYLGLEGVRHQTRENGRLVNNFPDVRMRAATYLGELGTPEARDTLVRMVLDDNEPMVITEAIKALGNIGLNDNDNTVNTISWVVARFDNLNPDNLLAFRPWTPMKKSPQQTAAP